MINLQAPLNFFGYGVASRGILDGFRQLGQEVALWPIGSIEIEKEEQEWIKKCIQNQDCFDINGKSIRLYHQFDLAEHIGFGLKVGFPIFELDKFTKRELHHMGSCDKLYVCSEWGKDILINNSIKSPINICPLGVNRDIFNENIGTPDGAWTTFLNVGKWEIRKGHDILAQAFHEAFSIKDRVRLWLMSDNPFLNSSQVADWQRRYKEGKMGDKVTFIPRVQTRREVAQIMAQADCGVFPSRAEGWNLEALEMLSMGKRLIITDYSAHQEFCDYTNSLLIPINKTESAYDGKWFFNQGNWAAFEQEQMDCLISYLRLVHQSKSTIINNQGIEMAKKFNWKRSAEILCM